MRGTPRRAKAGVVFDAKTGIDHQATRGLPAPLDEAGLIVAPGVGAVQRLEEAIFDFVFIARSCREMTSGVGGLALEAGAIELIAGDEREIAVG